MKLYVEGGGDSEEQDRNCRRGYSALLSKAGFVGRMPRIAACGSRGAAYDRFKTALSQGEDAMLLVDSEEPVANPDNRWTHLKQRDDWDQPEGAEDKHVQFMATCMETWIVLDRATLRRVFGVKLRESALPPDVGLENRNRQDVQDRLEQATRECGPTKAYRKGRRSFQVLAELDPAVLRGKLSYFASFIDALDERL